MSRGIHDNVWRALERFGDVLDSELAAELAAVLPAGLDVAAPASESYFILRNEKDVRKHTANGNPLVYLYPFGREVLNDRTGGPSTRPTRAQFEVAVSVWMLREGGNDDFALSFKTASDDEREARRFEVLCGAIRNVVYKHIVDPSGGDDVLRAIHVGTDRDVELYDSKRTGTGFWTRTVWTIDQIVNTPQQTT